MGKGLKAERRKSREPPQSSLLSPADPELTLNLLKARHRLTPAPGTLGSISLPTSRVPAASVLTFIDPE